MIRGIGSFLAVAFLVLWWATFAVCEGPLRADAPSPGAANCSACHEKQVKSMKDSAMHVSSHANKGVDTCTGCHEEAALKKSHVNVTGSRPVKARRYSREFCLKCHGTPAELAKATAKSKILTDTRGKVVNPHDIPNIPKHAKVDECANCHKEHKANPNSMEYCMGCHHTGEFACAKCHS
ncbi:MAG TPA: cytochrome c3 family protein [Syntrophorhabdaceae bacterium]|jgi:hypothetical protein